MTAPRIVVPGATTAITRRTILRKAFFAPWHPLVEQCWLYALADAQRHTRVAVHHSVLVVSHHHTTVTPSEDNLPEFLWRFHRDLSCSLHTLLCAERYDAPRELLDKRPSHAMRLMDATAQGSHLVYERLNPCAAGLVDRPEHMPLRSLGFDRWKVGFIEVERPPLYFDNSRPDKLRLELTPPPLLYEVFGGDMERLVYHMNKLTDHGLRAIRKARTRPPMGAKALRRLHPWNEPRTLREPGGVRVPTFRFGASGMVARRERIDGAKEVRAFRRAHHGARCARRDGDLDCRFPFGTYAARVHHGAPVEPQPPTEARITRPGPLLADVRVQIAGRNGNGTRELRATLLDEVRDAFADEASDIVADVELDLVEAKPVRSAGGRDRAPGGATKAAATGHGAATGEDEPAPVPARVRHRFDRPSQEREAARRLIFLRDRRRGRRPSGHGPHGSDPPG